ncbi:pyridoxal phosphate homeostasis protein [[Candida] jaroonii]|uniref:Pyridoxal phosphate homeostasis protein n=1 Tax=[Candida] jaroonii TaxID=467808 RepID=A0ACA9Y8T3_9ASCO|nr:pyridoxal phosphate homeostasis protein [[Candida] jaroonii]
MSALPSIARQKELLSNYESIAKVVSETAKKYVQHKVNLVAVSKLKPSSDIMGLYNEGVRHFGENYVQELVTKSQELPKDIKWHFIGTLQTDKCKILAKQISNLYAVETIDSLKKCKKLNSLRKEIDGDVINVYLQINTSDEPQKSGYSIVESERSLIYESVEFLLSEECSHLNFQGLMTIGSIGESFKDENEDFTRLVNLKNELNEKYSLDLQTSMGMSNDFEDAIKKGSSSVRVGSSIFGSRPPKN